MIEKKETVVKNEPVAKVEQVQQNVVPTDVEKKTEYIKEILSELK
jgi:hypothetical protein